MRSIEPKRLENMAQKTGATTDKDIRTIVQAVLN